MRLITKRLIRQPKSIYELQVSFCEGDGDSYKEETFQFQPDELDLIEHIINIYNYISFHNTESLPEGIFETFENLFRKDLNQFLNSDRCGYLMWIDSTKLYHYDEDGSKYEVTYEIERRNIFEV